MRTPGDEEQKPPEPLPEDEDKNAVLASLDDIDPCALLDVEDLEQPDGVEKVAVSSHQCAFEAGGQSLTVTVGTGLDHLNRIEYAEEPVSGVKAYRMQGDTDGPGACTWSIPVTFTDAIEFRYETESDEDDDSCSSLKRYAERGVETLTSSGRDSLFYEPGEPDVAVRGDCRYFFQPGGVEDCGPYSGANPQLTGDRRRRGPQRTVRRLHGRDRGPFRLAALGSGVGRTLLFREPGQHVPVQGECRPGICAG